MADEEGLGVLAFGGAQLVDTKARIPWVLRALQGLCQFCRGLFGVYALTTRTSQARFHGAKSA